MATMTTIVEDKIWVGKCGQQKPDHHINECEFPHKYANCGDHYLVFAISCENWKQ